MGFDAGQAVSLSALLSVLLSAVFGALGDPHLRRDAGGDFGSPRISSDVESQTNEAVPVASRQHRRNRVLEVVFRGQAMALIAVAQAVCLDGGKNHSHAKRAIRLSAKAWIRWCQKEVPSRRP